MLDLKTSTLGSMARSSNLPFLFHSENRIKNQKNTNEDREPLGAPVVV